MTAAPSIAPQETGREVDTSPIEMHQGGDYGLDPLWRAVEPELRARSNDIHLPLSFAYADRLCDVYPEADAEVVRVSILLHDTGWGRVDESKIISEGFSGDWRKAEIRYEHERQGCLIAEEVLPGLGYDQEFIAKVTAIIDGHDTRAESQSVEDSLVRDADRLWRFGLPGIALSTTWFQQTPQVYCRRLREEIIPELITGAARTIALAELDRVETVLKVRVI